MSIYLPDRSVIVDAMNGRRNRRELLADHSPPPESRMKEKREIPKFKSEADEAAWWYAHREETARWMEEAAATGQTTTLSEVLQRARRRAGTTPTVSIRIAPEDIARARGLAEKKGLRYQTYLKMLLHEALEREQRRVAG